jgi:hypothetical protein
VLERYVVGDVAAGNAAGSTEACEKAPEEDHAFRVVLEGHAVQQVAHDCEAHGHQQWFLERVVGPVRVHEGREERGEGREADDDAAHKLALPELLRVQTTGGSHYVLVRHVQEGYHEVDEQPNRGRDALAALDEAHARV